MDRRHFLKTTSVAAAAVGVSACAPKTVSTSSAQASDTEGKKIAQNFPGVGVLGYGCMRWSMIKGEDGKNHVDQDEVNRLVDYALEHGVNYFDTAPVYLEGESEKAAAIALNRHPRESWILATKLSNFMDAGYQNSVNMYRNSLATFNTDYIDYYLMHSVGSKADFDKRFVDNGGLIDFLLKEREAGHIRHLGFSFHGTKSGFLEMMQLHEKYHWDFVQIQMNYIDWTHAGARATDAKYLYEELTKRNIPVVIMEPLRGGRLANLPEGIARELKEREPEASLASWAFRFAGTFPNVLAVLSGMTYMEHLVDNVRTYTDFKRVTEEEIAFLDDVAERMESYPLIRCTACQYCMPCPYGINIPAIFKFYNDNINAGTYVTSKEQEGYERMRRKYLLQYNKDIPAVRQADHCISCNKCVSKCPQRIAIPRELQRIDTYIEKLKQDTL